MKIQRIALVILIMTFPLAMIIGNGGNESEVASNEPVNILWWSHWANEPAKVATIEFIADEYRASNPNVNIEIVWWDKNPLKEAYRNTMMAGGDGAPDICTDMAEDFNPQAAESGWYVPLDDAIPWENIVAGSRENGTFKGPDGQMHAYKWNIGSQKNMILYNKEIFSELGIEVPSDYTFTSREFLEIIQKGSEAGYVGFANAIGNRWYAATYFTLWPLYTMVGPEAYNDYLQGLRKWDTPETEAALKYCVALREAGAFHDSFSSMTIDEFHVYFHTQRKAMMLAIPTWYTGRAFKPQAEGGQDPDWEFGMLRYPTFEGGKANGKMLGGFESGYIVSASSEGANRETALDILGFASQPRYGAAWSRYTNSPSAIANSPADAPSEIPESDFGWYVEELGRVYGDVPVDQQIESRRSGDFKNALEIVLNQGIPQGLVTIEEGMEALSKAAE